MGIRAQDLRTYVIGPTLRALNAWSLSAENLLLGTAAQESQLGYYLHQIKGSALGIYQIEPATHHDVWKNYLAYRTPLAESIYQLGMPNEEQLIFNLSYATAIARVIYLRVKEPLPKADDMDGLATYYKQYYNTHKGKATTKEFIDNYKRFIQNG